MDLKTENRIAAILMEEARKFGLQAEKEGVGVYLRQPKVRGRPNSRFLTATVLGVQQANRAVEVHEMWRVRKKELELDDRLKLRSEYRSRSRNDKLGADSLERHWWHDESDKNTASLCTSSKQEDRDCNHIEDDSFRDEEIEEFLHSRVKRGRGSIGSRMDEPGPFVPSTSKGQLLENADVRMVEEWEQRVLGPEISPFLKKHQYQSDDDSMLVHDGNKVKKSESTSSKKKKLSKHRSKEHKSQDKKRKDKKSSSKHQHH